MTTVVLDVYCNCSTFEPLLNEYEGDTVLDGRACDATLNAALDDDVYDDESEPAVNDGLKLNDVTVEATLAV